MALLVLLCAAQFMLILDVTVVNVAAPSIQSELGISTSDLQWIITAYTVTFGGLLLLGGRAADLFGRRRMFLTGLLVFTVASLGASLAESSTVLIAARAFQGIGAAMLSPAALSLITSTFPEGSERNRALGIWAAVASSGGAFGLLLGGVLTETLGWQSIFFINIPVGVAVAFGAVRMLPRTPGEKNGPIDFAGALAGTLGLVALIYGLVEAQSAGWASTRSLATFAVAAVSLSTFVALESRVREPLVNLAIFRKRPTVIALVLLMVGIGALFSGLYFSSLYLQGVLGHSALRTGIEFMPTALAIIIASHIGGSLVAKVGAKPVIMAGFSLLGVGSLLLTGIAPDGTFVTDILPGMLLLGLGAGFSITGIMITAMSGVDHHETGMVSGLTTSAHEIGIALTLAVLTAVATSALPSDAATGSVPDVVATVTGYGDAFSVAAIAVVAGLILAAVGLRQTDVAPGTKMAIHAH